MLMLSVFHCSHSELISQKFRAIGRNRRPAMSTMYIHLQAMLIFCFGASTTTPSHFLVPRSLLYQCNLLNPLLGRANDNLNHWNLDIKTTSFTVYSYSRVMWHTFCNASHHVLRLQGAGTHDGRKKKMKRLKVGFPSLSELKNSSLLLCIEATEGTRTQEAQDLRKRTAAAKLAAENRCSIATSENQQNLISILERVPMSSLLPQHIRNHCAESAHDSWPTWDWCIVQSVLRENRQATEAGGGGETGEAPAGPRGAAEAGAGRRGAGVARWQRPCAGPTRGLFSCLRRERESKRDGPGGVRRGVGGGDTQRHAETQIQRGRVA